MTDTEPDLRTLPLPEALAWLREHGEPADPRPDIDTASLKRRFPRLAHVRTRDLVVAAPSGPQPARLYRDDTAAHAGAALVWVHGGAFIGGHLDMPESNWVALELAARGIPVLAVDYVKCLGDVHFPAPSDDVLAAWRFARERSAELFGVEPGALLLGGASAGGNLTAGAAARLRDAGERLPAGLVLVYPALDPDGAHPGAVPDPSSPTAQLSLNFAGSEARLHDPHAFPGLGSVGGFPPSLVVVCEHDGLRPSGEAFAARLANAGRDATLHVEPDADHAHINEPSHPGAARTLDAIAGWIAGRW
ncbi:alpha/beta hydrolase [Leifsonia shinshuensis]|uniref:Acetyl esterase/lipase n=1 Tax=Leifsonia shinshuensis TaxID=150026 RepID=A0A853CY19_9MICO|nr:alpha/beta hydrolase fold domain-containing protein [Leifsonia shinshuensis]NYJ25428.1 acetyl esterase/lipase [Leifsonia shinshuensis]